MSIHHHMLGAEPTETDRVFHAIASEALGTRS